jgi:hypothetical protein
VIYYAAISSSERSKAICGLDGRRRQLNRNGHPLRASSPPSSEMARPFHPTELSLALSEDLSQNLITAYTLEPTASADAGEARGTATLLEGNIVEVVLTDDGFAVSRKT